MFGRFQKLERAHLFQGEVFELGQDLAVGELNIRQRNVRHVATGEGEGRDVRFRGGLKEQLVRADCGTKCLSRVKGTQFQTDSVFFN